MDESPEKVALQTLAVNVVKGLTKLNKLLTTEASPRRDKQMAQALKEIEVYNDEAMRGGLKLSPQVIARMKTGRSPRLPAATPPDPQRGLDHKELMEYHANHIRGPLPNGAAQGAALKWLLDHFSVDALKAEYEAQLKEQWRGRVCWISVKRDIGKRKVQAQSNGHRASPPVETIRDRTIRESCPDCHGTKTYIDPKRGAKQCDHRNSVVFRGSDVSSASENVH